MRGKWITKCIQGNYVHGAAVVEWLNEIGAASFRIERNVHDYIVFAFVPENEARP